MLVVHPHFHPRRSGVTGHTELIVPALAPLCEARAIGEILPPEVPRITFAEVWRRARTETVVWHAHRNNELLVGFLLRLFRPRTRVVFTSHSPRPHGRFTHFLIRFVDALVTLNSHLAGFIDHASRIVQHGLDLKRFTPPTDRAAAWQKLGLPGERGLGVVGRVRPNKGQGDFVEALAPLLAQHPGWTPVLVGLVKDSDRAWAEGLKARLPQLVLAGVKADTAPWYQGLSILVQPTHGEAFSMVLIEAMASGCAVVASRLPAVAEVVEDGVSGFLYEPGDVEALRRLLAKLLEDPALVARVGEAAAARARERFGIEHEARALFEVYGTATAGTAAASAPTSPPG